MSPPHRLRASCAAMLEVLAPFGFDLVDEVDGQRGSRVEMANACARVAVTIDWLEGEVDVSVRGAGHRHAVPLADLVDLSAAKGLSTRRLPRDVTVGMLERRLAQVGALLADQTPDLLRCGGEAPET